MSIHLNFVIEAIHWKGYQWFIFFILNLKETKILNLGVNVNYWSHTESTHSITPVRCTR